MIDLNKVKFITTPEGIRGAIYDNNIVGSNMLLPTFIHRYDTAMKLGLFYGSIKDPNMVNIRWKSLRDKFNISLKEFSAYQKDPGFVYTNESSSNRQESKYEQEIPEYIDTDMILLIAMHLRNEIASKFRAKVIQEIIPFYQKYASPEQINSIPILNSVNNIQRELTPPTNFYGTSYSMHKENIDLMLNRLQQIINSANTGLNALDVSLDKLDSYIWQTFNMPLSAYVLIMKSSFETGHNTIVDINYIMDAIFNNDNLYFAMIKCINTACEEQMSIVYKKYNESVIGNIVGTVTIYIGGLGTDNIINQQTIEIKGDPNREVELFDCVFKESDLVTDLMTCYANLKNLTARYANPDIFHYTIKSNLLGCKIKLKEDTFNLKKPLNVTSFENYPKYEDPNL